MKKILVIDDSEVNLYLIQSIFENEPEVEVAIENSSKRGLQQLEKMIPDILILDLMMPHLDGFGLLERMRSNEKTTNIPVLVISANYDKESIQRCRDLGAIDYIVKPISLQTVEEKINAIFRNAELTE